MLVPRPEELGWGYREWLLLLLPNWKPSFVGLAPTLFPMRPSTGSPQEAGPWPPCSWVLCLSGLEGMASRICCLQILHPGAQAPCAVEQYTPHLLPRGQGTPHLLPGGQSTPHLLPANLPSWDSDLRGLGGKHHTPVFCICGFSLLEDPKGKTSAP